MCGWNNTTFIYKQHTYLTSGNWKTFLMLRKYLSFCLFFINHSITLNIKAMAQSINLELGSALVFQWLRICLPMQGTQIWSLVWEDSTCCRATKPLRHNYIAHVQQLPNYLHALEPMFYKRRHCSKKAKHHNESSPFSPQLEKAHTQHWRPSRAKK